MTRAAMQHEHTTPLVSIAAPGARPILAGLRVGQVVTGHLGRPMRVLDVDEYVISGDEVCGPYAALSPIDEPGMRVIWPRHWYTAHGEQLRMFS